MCESLDFRRGVSIDWSRHKIDLKITRIGAYSQRDLIFNLQTGTRTGASHIQELALAHQIHGVPSS
jgi:hypothetical protein